MTKYEIMFMVKATLDEKELDSITKEAQKLITNDKGKVIEFKDLGRKKLAYEINKETSAFYYLMDVEANSSTIQEFDRKMRINENVIRHLVLRKESE